MNSYTLETLGDTLVQLDPKQQLDTCAWDLERWNLEQPEKE